MEREIELKNKMSDIRDKIESLKMRIALTMNNDKIKQYEEEYEELMYLYYECKTGLEI